MISTRQFEILHHLYTMALNNADEGESIEKLAEFHDVTTRTIRSDIQTINDSAKNFGLHIELGKGQGVAVTITDKEKANKFIIDAMNQVQESMRFVDKESRAKYIIEMLMLKNRKKYIRLEDLANELYISQSALSQDLKNVESILSKYDLKLEKKRGIGIRIIGSTLNKKDCLCKESMVYLGDNIMETQSKKFGHMIDLSREMVTNVLIKNKYNLSDIALQNLILHVATTIEMLLHDNQIDDDVDVTDYSYLHEYQIAEQILELARLKLGAYYTSKEVNLLTNEIHGKREYDSDDYIADEINNLVFKGLKKIKEVYNLDFSDRIDLRISLALHLNPLMARLKDNMQIPNEMTYFVKQNFALSYEIAVTFISAVLPDYAKKINDDELCYLACHFTAALNYQEAILQNKGAIIITKSKRSNVVLLQQQLKSKFPIFTNISISNAFNYQNINLNKYDCIIVTETDLTMVHPNSIYINGFIGGEEDDKRIELAINGFDVERDLVSKFHEDLFEIGYTSMTKDDLIHELFMMAKRKYAVEDDLLESIIQHEENNSSYFGNRLVIIHPENPYPHLNEAFVCVYKLNKGIPWGNFDVNMAFLLVLPSSDISQYKIWNYLSFLISNERYVKALHAANSYQEFIDTIRSIFHLNPNL